MGNLKPTELATIICFALASEVTAHEPLEDFEDRVIDVILERPEVVYAALKILERANAEEERLKTQQLVADNAEDLFKSGGAGNLAPDHEPLLVEFFDYRCVYCAQSVGITDVFADQHDNRVRLIEFPILGPESENISKLAIAVRNVEGLAAYRRFHANMFAETNRPKTDQTAKLIVAEMGIDIDAIAQAAEGQDVLDELSANKQIALALGINGTPAYVGALGLGGGVQTIDQLEALAGVNQ